MSYSAEVVAGRTKLAEIKDEDNVTFRVVGRRGGETHTYVASRIEGRWYIIGNAPRTGGRAYDSLCAFFSRMEILSLTQLV